MGCRTASSPTAATSLSGDGVPYGSPNTPKATDLTSVYVNKYSAPSRSHLNDLAAVAARVPDRDMLQRLLVARSYDEVALQPSVIHVCAILALKNHRCYGIEACLADAPDFRSARSDHLVVTVVTMMPAPTMIIMPMVVIRIVVAVIVIHLLNVIGARDDRHQNGATGAAFNVAHVTTSAIAAIEIACIIRFMTLSFNLKTSVC